MVKFERGVVPAVATLGAAPAVQSNQIDFSFSAAQLLSAVGLQPIVGIGILTAPRAESSLSSFERLRTVNTTSHSLILTDFRIESGFRFVGINAIFAVAIAARYLVEFGSHHGAVAVSRNDKD